jgi:proteasome lid subunit RPN8/RPN11
MWENKKYKGNLQACSLAPLPRIHVAREVLDKIEMLMDRYPSTEWVGYLTGNTQNKEHYYITGISIPPHVSRGKAYAEVKPLHQPDNCIGLIHSHNSMGAFHSAVDNDYVDDNYTISCTASKKN